MQKIKKPVSILLSLIMVLGLFTIVPFTVGALDGVSFIDANGNTQTANGVTEVSANTTAFSTGWYAVTSEITNNNRITCTGNVRLILCDGAKLTANSGIAVNEGSRITICGQSGGTGELEISTGIREAAALGSDQGKNSGTITINGGIITACGAISNNMGAAIGGGSGGNGTVIINGGTIDSTSYYAGAAIGGGFEGKGTVIINGGNITAFCNSSGAGIGGGASDSGNVAASEVTINGGTINATGHSGAAIGGGTRESCNVTINGGKITASSDGYYGIGGIGDGAFINATGSTVILNWTKISDRITSNIYNGAVTLINSFSDGDTVFEPGAVSDNSVLANKTLKPYSVTPTPIFMGHSISLNGDIGLNYYLNVDAEGTEMHFAWYNKTFDHTVTAADYDTVSGYYKVKVNVAAAEMNFPITATCKIGEDTLATDTYSVRQYADKILDSESDFSKDYAAKNGAKKYGLLVDLIKKMLDYGAKAQTRFGVTDVALANSGVDYTMQPVTADNIITKKTDMTKGLSKLGLTYIGTSVVFLSQTTLRHYYSVTNQNLFDSVKDSASFTYGEKGTRVYFERTDIPAALLDSAQTFGIGESEYNYSVLDYCKLVLSDESKPLSDRELSMATYWYNNAAKAYFYANDEYEDDMV